MKHFRKAAVAVGLAAVVAVGLAACAPGGSAPSARQSLGPISKSVGSGKITLTVWDQNTDGGINTAQQELNKQFEQKYPNVTINRVSRSFTDLKTTLKLALSGNNPPDVVQANQGYPDMGAFVKAGLLRPINDYAKLYGWNSYYPSSLLKLNSFSTDGKTWQGDNLYGISQTGELVGVYYNKSILAKDGITAPPKTLDEFTTDMQKVKAAGDLPLSYGDVEKSPGIHIYGVVLSALAGADAVNSLVAGKSGSWTGSDEVQAAATIQGWQKDGYITPGGNGVSQDVATADFGKGQSAFLIDGTWNEATLEQSPQGKNIGFQALTPASGTTPVTEGGEGLAWALTSKTKHADAAAAYINFITDRAASEVLVKTGNLPTVVPSDDKPATGTLAGDITGLYKTISQSNGITAYLDYSTPTFYDTLTAAAQDLVAEKVTPQQFTQTLQSDYASFLKSK
ncbi:extracellular solute-binding protein [Curtobacterium ammoniigenes]|uniref:extracellular solute-binding protein n=1 Tax=Curtobacterium ammoniigenes TaxID=395387 RepID=UPI000837357E|nr:extracellular solute-binding protein [Curtobacterium ammoniigenes]